MNVNLEYYKIFYYVATELSITGAAKKQAQYITTCRLPSCQAARAGIRDRALYQTC